MIYLQSTIDKRNEKIAKMEEYIDTIQRRFQVSEKTAKKIWEFLNHIQEGENHKLKVWILEEIGIL